jgi:hypothetical protein
MISKILTGHSFYGSVRYVHQDQNRAIILATEGVRDHDYKLMIQDFQLQHQMRPSKKQACFHSVLSFYPGENPGDKTMTEIAKKYLEEIGITNTQYVITKHTDKAHLHMHVIANMVDNNGNSIKDNWIGYRAKTAAQQLTQEYKLIPAVKKDLALTHLHALNASEANRYTIYTAITESLPACGNMEELERRLLKRGIETQCKFKSGTNEKQGISFKIGENRFKGSKIDRKFSLGNLERTLALHQKQVAVQRHEDLSKPDDHKIFVERKLPGAQTGTSNPGMFEQKEFKHESPKAPSLIEVLMKPEQTGNQLAGELSQDLARQRKKKRSRRIGH